MKLRAALGAGLLALSLSACGFHPLYGDGGGSQKVFSSIYVEPIGDDQGYELRNSLIDLLDATGEHHDSAYTLKITLSDQLQGAALQADTTITRYNYTLTAKYTLIDARTNTAVTNGEVSSLAAYNVVQSPYATLVSQKDAQRRTADQLAERIRLDLGVYFSKASSK